MSRNPQNFFITSSMIQMLGSVDRRIAGLRKGIDFALDTANLQTGLELIGELERIIPAEASFYRGVINFREENFAKAEEDFLSALRFGSPYVQSFAMVHLSSIANIKGDAYSEIKFNQEAKKFATHTDVLLELRTLEAYLLGAEGNYQQAADHLLSIRSLVRSVATQRPVKACRWTNDLAYYLGESGHVDAALRLIPFCLHSPFARFNPEWQKTFTRFSRKKEMGKKKVFNGIPKPQATVIPISSYQPKPPPDDDTQLRNEINLAIDAIQHDWETPIETLAAMLRAGNRGKVIRSSG